MESNNDKNERYASHKTVAQNLLNIAIIQSHVKLLVDVYGDDEQKHETPLIIFICLSISLQIFMFFLLSVLYFLRQDSFVNLFSENNSEENTIANSIRKIKLTSTFLNSVVTFLSGISLIINVTISALQT